MAAFSNGRTRLLNVRARGAPADDEIAPTIVRDAITADRAGYASPIGDSLSPWS